MQGDIYRAKQKTSKLRPKHDFSNIVSGVDDMSIHDVLDNKAVYNNRIEYEQEVCIPVRVFRGEI